MFTQPPTIHDGLLQTVLRLINDFISLARLEAKLAKESLVWSVVLLLFITTLLTSCWFTVLAIIFNFLWAEGLTMTGILVIILGINIATVLLVYRILIKLKGNFLFPVTRRQLNKLGAVNDVFKKPNQSA